MNVLQKIPENILHAAPDTNEINLSIAENYLIRSEILEEFKSSIAHSLRANVGDPTRCLRD